MMTYDYLVTSTKFLGILIHENLTWDTHLNYICNKLSRVTAILSRLKHQLPTFVLRLIYNSLFAPHLLYGISVWGNSSANSLDRIIKLQKKALRHVTKSKYNSHSEPLLSKMHILSLKDSFKLQCCKLMYKKKVGILHSYHCSQLPTSRVSQSVITRQSHDIIIGSHNYISKINSLNFKIGTSWNELPNNFKEITTLSEFTFVKKVKKTLHVKLQNNMFHSKLLCL